MEYSLAETARAGRRAALSALQARLAPGGDVVSFLENSLPRRVARPEFRSVRPVAPRPSGSGLPMLVLTNPVAA